MTRLIVTTLSSVLCLAVLSHAAQADFLTAKERRAGKVTACSTYGSHDCYTARLVPSPLGMKMRLKSGYLIDCAGDCRDTLRRATVDFWNDQRERSNDGGR
jgi:hypothetical protein